MDELDKNRATLSASGDTGVATFTLQTKRANLAAVLDLLNDSCRRAQFGAAGRRRAEELFDPACHSRAVLETYEHSSPFAYVTPKSAPPNTSTTFMTST